MYGTYVYSRCVDERRPICITSVPAVASCAKAAAFDWGSGGALIDDGLKKYSELKPSAGVASVGCAGVSDGSPAGTWSRQLPVAGARLSQATIARTRGSHWPTRLTAEAPSECPAMPTRVASRSERAGFFDEKNQLRASSVPWKK